MQQVEEIHYNETFSPMVKPISIWIILSLAISNDWNVCQIDIGNSFLNGVIDA